MVWNLWINEEKKIMKRPLLWVGILLLSVIILLYMVAMANSNPYPEIIQMQIVWPMALVIYLRQFIANPMGAGLILVAVASTATAQEYTWHSHQTYLCRGVSRWKMILAKFLALLLPIFLIVSIPMIVTTVVSGYYTIHFNGALNFAEVNFIQIGYCILLGVFAMLPYGALSILLSVIGRSLVLPLAGGMGWILIELVGYQTLNSLGKVGETIAKSLPVGVVMGLLMPSRAIARVIPEGIAGADIWEPLHLLLPEIAASTLGIYTLTLLAMVVFIFYKQDFSD